MDQTVIAALPLSAEELANIKLKNSGYSFVHNHMVENNFVTADEKAAPPPSPAEMDKATPPQAQPRASVEPAMSAASAASATQPSEAKPKNPLASILPFDPKKITFTMTFEA